MKSIFLTIVLVGVMYGCATPQIILYTPFNEEEAKLVFKDGNNTIKGSALLRQNNGGVVTCAGRNISLLAATNYSNERMFAIYNSNERGFIRIMFANQRPPIANDNPDYYRMAKNTLCDAQGYFKFEKVADGEYYLVTSIQWQVSQYMLEGGALMRRISVKGDEIKDIVLSQ